MAVTADWYSLLGCDAVCSAAECWCFDRTRFFHLQDGREIKLWCGTVGDDTRCWHYVVTKRLYMFAGLHAKWVTLIAVCPAICIWILKWPTWLLASHFLTKHLKTSQISSSLLHDFPYISRTYSFGIYEYVPPSYTNPEFNSENFGIIGNFFTPPWTVETIIPRFLYKQIYKEETVRSIFQCVFHAWYQRSSILRGLARVTITIACCLRHCATSLKVMGSIPDGVIGFLQWHNPFDRTIDLGSTQPSTCMTTKNIFWGVKAGGVQGWQPYHLLVPTV
jgi:hypothetical protein